MSDPPKPDPKATLSTDTPIGDRSAESEWLREAVHTPREARSSRGADGPAVVVCDEGDLDDVHELLAQLDQQSLRVRPASLDQLEAWDRPRRLFITTVRLALFHPRTLPRIAGPAISIAVANDDSQTMCTTMLRRGFHYVVRRPVHPEALRLLLMQILYTGPEQRLVARFPFGGRVRWRSGWRTGTCTVTEISAHGCRMLTGQHFPLDALLHLRVPAALASSGDLRLRGRVVRRDISETAVGPRAHVALRFVKLSDRTRAHLDALLAERASGPAALGADRGDTPSAPEVLRPTRGSRMTLREDPVPPPPSAPTAPRGRERRRRPRVAWHQEVVALDDGERRVLYTLMGTELSTGGLRVEPHPLLRLGDDLKLALYDAGHIDPILVDARLVYDDGRRGFGVAFRDVSPEALARLEDMVGSLPPVSALSDEDDKPQGVVMGRIVSLDPKDER